MIWLCRRQIRDSLPFRAAAAFLVRCSTDYLSVSVGLFVHVACLEKNGVCWHAKNDVNVIVISHRHTHSEVVLLLLRSLNLVVVEKAVSKILSEAVSDVLLDLLRLEVNGLQVVDLQMEAARLAALECLRQAVSYPIGGTR